MTATTHANESAAIASEIATAVKHSIVYGLGGILTKALGFFLLPLYTHYLTPRDYGMFELLDLTMSLLGDVSQHGTFWSISQVL